jgi:hypothetical protein
VAPRVSPFDWVCNTCGLTFHQWDGYVAYRTVNGKVRRVYTTEGTVFGHRYTTGHMQFHRQAAPAV